MDYSRIELFIWGVILGMFSSFAFVTISLYYMLRFDRANKKPQE